MLKLKKATKRLNTERRQKEFAGAVWSEEIPLSFETD
jgi:hypothetical protein